MNVVYFSNDRKPKQEKIGIRFLGLIDLIKQSDVISLHCSLNDETKNILNKSNMKFMKKGFVLLNSARSELVDLDILYNLCKQNKISAWLEAIEDEEIREKFKTLDNIYLTPHFGWMTKEAQRKLREMTLNNIKAYLEGNLTNKII